MRHHARIEDHTPLFLYHVDTEEVHSWVSRITILSKAWIRFNELPPCPQDQCWYKHKREKSNAPVCDQSKKLLVCTTSNIKIPGQGDTHRVKMKSKASSQTTDAVVAEWQSACETHGFAILSQTLRSVLTLPATWASINPPGKDSRKARWLPVHSHMLCFHMYKPRTNSEYTSHRTLYNGRNTSSGKALACWFFICTNLKQTLFKPQIYGAGRCQQVRQDFKGKFN